jgi:hypothetical protein
MTTGIVIGFLLFSLNLVVGSFVWSGIDTEDKQMYNWYKDCPRKVAWFAQPLVLTLWPVGLWLWWNEKMIPESKYRQALEEGFVATQEDHDFTRLSYLGSFVFDFTTDDGDMDELFATKALEVCGAVSDGTTYEYIKDTDNYQWFLVMVNMPFFANRIEWGTSIRGARWAPKGKDSHIKYTSTGLYLDGVQEYGELQFTVEQWKAFINAIIEFSKSS